VFIFRFEAADTLDWPSKPVATTTTGLVPVVYRLDLNQPRSLFAMQSFAVQDKDAAQRVILPPRADEARAIPPRPEDVAADRGKPARGSTATRWSA